MPHYSSTLEIARPLAELFSFFTKPRNLLQLAPPELSLELLTAPDVLILGARLVWKGKRYGVSQQIIQDVATFDMDKLIIVEQKQGPFKRWIHSHQFLAIDGGTLIYEKIDFEPPGGMLGFMITADSIRKDLDKLFAYRVKKLKELFTP
jgi:ligand-binding SRPBCC domain-containing protein